MDVLNDKTTEENKKMNKNVEAGLVSAHGITLIALVFTIVVLIILAGVAISLSLGENGIFSKAQQAKQEYVNQQEKEKKEIGELTNEIDVKTVGSTRTTQTVEKITFSNIKSAFSVVPTSK